MQDITEKLKAFAGQAGEGLNKGLDTLKDKASQAGDYLQANPTVAAMLLAGGGAGLLGGYLTSQQDEDERESKMSRRGRILRNALLAGTAGAGAVGLGAAGYKRLAEATPEGSLNPVQEKLTSPFTRGVGAIGAGALGFRSGLNMDKEDLADQARAFLSAEDQLKAKGMSRDALITLAKTPRTGTNTRSTVFSGSPSGFLDTKNSRILKMLLGSSRAGQLARVGGAAGIFLPELIGGAGDLARQIL
jgi:hypothetical protein